MDRSIEANTIAPAIQYAPATKICGATNKRRYCMADRHAFCQAYLSVIYKNAHYLSSMILPWDPELRTPLFSR